MRSKIITVVGVLSTVVLLVSCTGAPKVSKPEVKVPLPEKHGGLTYLYLTGNAEQMSGVAPTMRTMKVGESIVIYARGGDETGKWFKLPNDVVVNWKAGKELEITPTTGHVITVKAVGPAGEIPFLEATAVTKDGTKVEGTLQIEIKE